MDLRRKRAYGVLVLCNILLLFFTEATTLANDSLGDSPLQLRERTNELLEQSRYEEMIAALKLLPDSLQPKLYAKDWYELYHLRAMAYEKTGSLKNAYDAFLFHRKLKDSVFNISKVEELNIIKSEYQQQANHAKEIAEKIATIEHSRSIRNKEAVIVGIATLFLIAIGILMMMHRNNKKKLLISQRQLDLATHNYKIKLIEARMEGESKERESIAVYLHEEIAQQLTNVQEKLNTVSIKSSELITDFKLIEVREIIDAAQEQLLQSVYYLHPPELNLIDELQKFILKIKDQIPIALFFSGDPRVAKDTLFIYRIIQELIQNMIKHSRATEATLNLEFNSASTIINMNDNGVGIDLDDNGKGFGLTNIFKSIAAIDGSIHLENNNGTFFTISIPNENAISFG